MKWWIVLLIIVGTCIVLAAIGRAQVLAYQAGVAAAKNTA